MSDCDEGDTPLAGVYCPGCGLGLRAVDPPLPHPDRPGQLQAIRCLECGLKAPPIQRYPYDGGTTPHGPEVTDAPPVDARIEPCCYGMAVAGNQHDEDCPTTLGLRTELAAVTAERDRYITRVKLLELRMRLIRSHT